MAVLTARVKPRTDDNDSRNHFQFCKEAGKFGYRVDGCVGAGGPEFGRHGRCAHYAHRRDSGAAGHLNVVGSIADVDALFGGETQSSKRELQGRGMRFPERGVFRENAYGEAAAESEFPKLLPDARAATARDQTQDDSSCEEW